MECYAHDDGAFISEYPDLDEPFDDWTSGIKINGDVPKPIVFEIWEEDMGRMPSMFNSIMLLMTDELIGALRECGITNFDCYEAIIEETFTGNVYNNYKAVNIIGLVSALDMNDSKSTVVGLADDDLATRFFTKLSVDETKTQGLLLFRLAELDSAIFIHENIVKCIKAKGFEDLDFVLPSKFKG
jgi:hypothetical protein